MGISDQATFCATGEAAFLLKPGLKYLLDLGVAQELLEKDVDFQSLVLRLAQKGFGGFSLGC